MKIQPIEIQPIEIHDAWVATAADTRQINIPAAPFEKELEEHAGITPEMASKAHAVMVNYVGAAVEAAGKYLNSSDSAKGSVEIDLGSFGEAKVDWFREKDFVVKGTSYPKPGYMTPVAYSVDWGTYVRDAKASVEIHARSALAE